MLAARLHSDYWRNHFNLSRSAFPRGTGSVRRLCGPSAFVSIPCKPHLLQLCHCELHWARAGVTWSTALYCDCNRISSVTVFPVVRSSVYQLGHQWLCQTDQCTILTTVEATCYRRQLFQATLTTLLKSQISLCWWTLHVVKNAL